MATVVSAAVILVAFGFIIRSNLAGPSPRKAPTKAFFTTDDGNTLFVDDFAKATPFDHNGLQAVRAVTFTCDGGQHHWVQYLEKYANDAGSPAAEARASDLLKARAQGMGKGLLVKRPADLRWVAPTEYASFSAICLPKAPQGMHSGLIEPFDPE